MCNIGFASGNLSRRFHYRILCEHERRKWTNDGLPVTLSGAKGLVLCVTELLHTTDEILRFLRSLRMTEHSQVIGRVSLLP